MLTANASLLEVLSQVDAPSEVRLPFVGIVSLTQLVMLARIREMEFLVPERRFTAI